MHSRLIVEIVFPPFVPPAEPKVKFPFFDPNGESFLTLLGRDNLLKEINRLILPVSNSRWSRPQKYMPIIISTSRGMGKSFFLKMIGMQKVKAEFKNAWIEDAVQCGRILSFDFVKGEGEGAIKSADDIPTFFASLMVYFLCLLFDGTRVDGINFEYISGLNNVTKFVGKQEKFNDWKSRCMWKDADGMMDEYIRLTNIAFSVDPTSYMYKTPPVFLFDEVQSLTETTDVISKFSEKDTRYHTLLSLLFIQLSTKHRPVCICTGTYDGEIKSITDHSCLYPQVYSLTPLVNDYLEYWKQMTDEYNKNSDPQYYIQMAGDEDLIRSLAYASYQIPRLLFVAHQIWLDLRQKGITDKETYIQSYDDTARIYYTELWSVLDNYTPEEIAHIILCCGVHWTVEDASLCVPGTNIKWNNLIWQSIIFPYLDDCYMFPFTLVWRNGREDSQEKIKSNIENYCRQTVKNLDVKDLFLSFDTVKSFDLNQLRVCFESLFSSSVAVKYFIRRLSDTSGRQSVRFTSIYDFKRAARHYFKEPEKKSEPLLTEMELNLSEGLFYPNSEITARDTLPLAVVHDKENHNAQHAILLPTDMGVIAVSTKAAFDADREDLEKQLRLSTQSDENVAQLLFLYFGSSPNGEKVENLPFLDGSGVCNGRSIDLLKKFKAHS